MKKGFTLIEILVAMSIFVVFTSILINSYTNIVKAQRAANEYRVVYSEARYVFDKVVDEIRNSSIVYGNLADYRDFDRVYLLGKDDGEVSQIVFDGKNVLYQKGLGDSVNLNSERIVIKEFKIYISPGKDPYNFENAYDNRVQFQPKVTVYADFENFDMQTTVSSKVYNESFEPEYIPPLN
jgi:prepilin-type N-terminal cleavage/methylation domain-containing protein